MDDNLDARTVATPPPPVYGAPPPKRGIPVWVWIAGGVVACGAVCLCAVVGISLSGSDLTKTLGVPGLGTSTPAGGGKIAFVTNFDQKAGRGTLSVMNVDGSGQVPLTANAAADEDPSWSSFIAPSLRKGCPVSGACPGWGLAGRSLCYSASSRRPPTRTCG